MTPEDTLAWIKTQMRYEPAGADWLDKIDLRCWAVTNELANIYNLVDRSLPNCGLSSIGSGIGLLVRKDYATQDFGELTGLVLAAHQHAVRVSISSAALWAYQENPYDFESGYAEVTEDWETAERWDGGEPATRGGCNWRKEKHGLWPDYYHQEPCSLDIIRDGPDEPWRHLGEQDGEEYDHAAEPSTIEVRPLTGYLELQLHPRDPWGTGSPDTWRSAQEHPTLPMLAARIDRRLGHRKTTRTQTRMAKARQ